MHSAGFDDIDPWFCCLLQEETFGPVVGIQAVSSDEEAIDLMNDSPYGLTASIWTDVARNPQSEEAFMKMVDEVGTGTVFLNRYAFSLLSFLSLFRGCA